ncbi:MAG: 3-dehydroquinate synthase [Lachnospiraceae bacterium]|nr:3-dehydroquinate synthase [Lachnospiraceae bacterium]
MQIHVDLADSGYDIRIGRGLLQEAGSVLNLNRKVLIVTDSGVPEAYAQTVAKQCGFSVIETIPAGEDSKSLSVFERLERVMLEHDFSRKDCVVAVGGGVVGDLAGFVASCYMRGIDFYNIPTTVLSQVDSSIGGKCAVNFEGVKNVLGAFYQPQYVLIDHDVLNTLPERQVSNGMAEAIKMALTFDAGLFEQIEQADSLSDLYPVIAAAIDLKRVVVEQDEKEQGLRKVLNFGHTLGHGIEAACLHTLLHGECVALGMIPMCSDEVKERLIRVLTKYDLPVSCDFDAETAMQAIRHDKKGNGNTVSTVYVDKAGTYELRDMTFDALQGKLAEIKA